MRRREAAYPPCPGKQAHASGSMVHICADTYLSTSTGDPTTTELPAQTHLPVLEHGILSKQLVSGEAANETGHIRLKVEHHSSGTRSGCKSSWKRKLAAGGYCSEDRAEVRLRDEQP